jgi:hypothetical protein
VLTKHLPVLLVSMAATALVGPMLSSTRAAAEEPGQACDAWDVEYQLAATLLVSDTVMGAGDGVQPIGPGKLVLRMANAGNGPATFGEKILSYELHQSAAFTSKALLWKTKVQTDILMSAPGEACNPAAEGKLQDRTLRWTTPVKGYRGDGTVTCEGTFCGTFGAPPKGTSPMHIPPHAVDFKSFDFAADLKTFTMGYAVVSKSDSPRQTARVSLAGREVRRACAPVKPCT